MSGLAGTISRMLARIGRPMVLKRRQGTGDTFAAVTVQGYLVAYAPGEITGEVRQGDARITIGPKAGDLVSPSTGDIVTVDGADWAVLSVSPRYVGPTVAGYALWVRGGGS